MWLLKETQVALIIRTKNSRGVQGFWGCLFCFQKNRLGGNGISLYQSPTNSRHCPRHLSWSWKCVCQISDCEEHGWSRPQLLNCCALKSIIAFSQRPNFPQAASNQSLSVILRCVHSSKIGDSSCRWLWFRVSLRIVPQFRALLHNLLSFPFSFTSINSIVQVFTAVQVWQLSHLPLTSYAFSETVISFGKSLAHLILSYCLFL